MKKERKHGRLCECPQCVQLKFDLYQERVEAMTEPRLPKDRGCSIPVRAHWRSNARHLNKQPRLHDLVSQLVRDIIKKG